MGARVIWEGLEELIAGLRHLPAALTDDAHLIVESAAEVAGDRIRVDYPSLSGNLRDHVTVTEIASGRFGVAYLVKNSSPHAWIFENGTEARHYITVNGKRHELGKMPPGHVFIRNAVRSRREMYGELKHMLVEHGLTVTGEP